MPVPLSDQSLKPATARSPIVVASDRLGDANGIMERRLSLDTIKLADDCRSEQAIRLFREKTRTTASAQ